jgi:hypothetical protein
LVWGRAQYGAVPLEGQTRPQIIRLALDDLGPGSVHTNSNICLRSVMFPREGLPKTSFIPTFYEHPHPNG